MILVVALEDALLVIKQESDKDSWRGPERRVWNGSEMSTTFRSTVILSSSSMERSATLGVVFGTPVSQPQGRNPQGSKVLNAQLYHLRSRCGGSRLPVFRVNTHMLVVPAPNNVWSHEARTNPCDYRG